MIDFYTVLPLVHVQYVYGHLTGHSLYSRLLKSSIARSGRANMLNICFKSPGLHLVYQGRFIGHPQQTCRIRLGRKHAIRADMLDICFNHPELIGFLMATHNSVRISREYSQEAGYFFRICSRTFSFCSMSRSARLRNGLIALRAEASAGVSGFCSVADSN